MSDNGNKFAAGGKIAMGIVAMGNGLVNGVGRCVAGVLNRRPDLIMHGVTEGVHHFEAGWHAVEEGLDEWNRAD